MRANIHFLTYLAEFFSEWEMLKAKALEKIKTHISCSITFLEIIYEIMWKNMTQPERPQMRFACRITKSIDTHSKYVIFIAFPLQQWLHEHASMLRYTYTACRVVLILLRCNLWSVGWKGRRSNSKTNSNYVLSLQGYFIQLSGLWQMSLDQRLNNE